MTTLKCFRSIKNECDLYFEFTKKINAKFIYQTIFNLSLVAYVEGYITHEKSSKLREYINTRIAASGNILTHER